METIRYTLKQFDRDHPDLAVFPENHGPLGMETKRKIYQQYHRGESVEQLAKRFCRTQTSIYRIIDEMRARRIMELPLDYIPNPRILRVRSQKIEQRVLGPAARARSREKAAAAERFAPVSGQFVRGPAVDARQEAHLFRKLNYLKFKASRLRDKLDPDQPQSTLMDHIERVYDEAVATKNQIVRANLRLVVSIAKRHVGRRTTSSSWSATATCR